MSFRLRLRLRRTQAAVAQLVEHQLPKLRVASSSLVCRSWKSAPVSLMDAGADSLLVIRWAEGEVFNYCLISTM